ncbi:hypothetical protein R69619_00414 [Paraburkholderia nemoris]|uniref:PIN domain-containing protein n=1 Tax=Paraburkholderia nemoris TaxID=2793076 RepID=UPI00190B8AF6|nr:PIN domain-containing protein [Paraburkholderia nemoris]MBK3737676.1 DUF4935 domain-containing protein [Paraburkholderia aspalathi]CAE6694564.1 hypothetical protein R69619_00414 [Paraburkholderia nemoris]
MALDPGNITRLAGINAPVLCLDTCSLIDVLRDPVRPTQIPGEASAALSLLTKLENPGGLICFLADQVMTELATHLQEEHERAENSLSKLLNEVIRVDEIATVFGSTATVNLTHFDGHVQRARSVVERWKAGADVAPQSGNTLARAFARMNAPVPRTPARRGKESIKDCVVVETYLETIQELRAAGFTSKAVFLSSNVNDYTGENKRLKPDLASEFSTLGITYTSQWRAAKASLGL